MKKSLLLIAALLLPALAPAEHHETAEAEVREALAGFTRAYAENRVDDYFGYYAEDASLYFYGARTTVADYYAEWKEIIAAGGGVEKNEESDVRVRMLPGGEAAVTSSFIDYRYRSPEGEITAEKGFESDVWQKIDGEWKIVNLHYTGIAAED